MSISFVDLRAQQNKIKENLDRRIAGVLAHGKYIMGPEVYELEEKLADYAGVRHCITCANGTDALLIALMALGIGSGDEVITTAFTYAATGEVIVRAGAKPVFADIDSRTYNIDPFKVEQAVTARTKAIIPVSLFGQCAAFDKINAIAKKYNLYVIEDGAQSFGATYRKKKSCSLSDIGCTSFFPTKPLGCYGDGGACFTNDDGIAAVMRQIRLHGQDQRYHHIRRGLNSRLDTLQAAVLLAKLEIFDEEIMNRRRVAARYSEGLQIAGVVTPYVSPENASVYAQYTIQAENRDKLESELKKAGVPTAVHYPIPLNRQPVFCKPDGQRGSLDTAGRAASRVISLPMSAWMTDDTVDSIVEKIKSY